MTSFADLGVPSAYNDALRSQGITDPFPIQIQTLPDAIAGKDILGRGRTGSGKTLAFSLPVAIRLRGARSAAGAPRAMIIVPTRELANQVSATLRPLARVSGLTVTTIVGGVSQHPQVKALRSGTDIVVATPGRLEDLIQQRECRLGEVQISVLDEADHLADLGFLPASKRLLNQTPRGGQRLLFSATLDAAVEVLVRKYLVNPVTHHVDTDQVPTMTHHMLTVSEADKAAVIQELVAGHKRTLVFTRTKHGAQKLAKRLSAAGIPAVDLHGNLSQNRRQANLETFSSGKARVLVATDIAARGIHVDGIKLVVHMDPPAEHKTYMHRCGRTARAGADGVAVTVGTHAQRRDITRMMRQAQIEPMMASVTPGHETIVDLVGPVAERSYLPRPVQQQTQRPAGRRRRR